MVTDRSGYSFASPCVPYRSTSSLNWHESSVGPSSKSLAPPTRSKVSAPRLADTISSPVRLLKRFLHFLDIFRQAGFFMSLLKTDFQLSVCLLVLELNRGPYLDTIYSKAVLIIGAPICIAHLIIGYKAVITASTTVQVVGRRYLT